MNLATHTWLSKLTDLNQDRSRGTAPHKPLLHLVVLDLFESGKLASGEFRRDGELAFRFNSYWSLGAVGRGSRPDVKLPFYHSRSDGFWTPFEEDGREAAARELARVARLDPGYLLCLADPGFRTAARRTILLTHFSGSSRAALAALLGIDLDAEAGEFPAPAPSAPEATPKREARFAFEVLPAYDFTCALTGYRMVAEDGTTILDAAHIRSFSQGGPCLVRNGLALTHRVGAAFTRQSRGATALYATLRRLPHPRQTTSLPRKRRPRPAAQAEGWKTHPGSGTLHIPARSRSPRLAPEAAPVLTGRSNHFSLLTSHSGTSSTSSQHLLRAKQQGP